MAWAAVVVSEGKGLGQGGGGTLACSGSRTLLRCGHVPGGPGWHGSANDGPECAADHAATGDAGVPRAGTVGT